MCEKMTNVSFFYYCVYGIVFVFFNFYCWWFISFLYFVLFFTYTEGRHLKQLQVSETPGWRMSLTRHRHFDPYDVAGKIE